MVLTGQHTQVLITGAGPSGLMMAAQLLRYGIQPMIIDSKQGPTIHSNALVVQAHTLEIYRQMGIVDGVVKNGNPVKGAAFFVDGDEKAKFRLTDIGNGQTPYPYLLLYQQNKNERTLLDFLTLHCCPVYWDTTLVTLVQTAQRVTARLQTGESTVDVTCDWLVGADGARSAVRKQLQIPFNGDTYAHGFYLADVALDNEGLSDDYVQLFLSKNSFAGLFPMPEPKNYRLIGRLPNGLINKKNLTIEDVLPLANKTAKINLNLVQNNWFSTYRLHHRMADKFREQRCFLIGDAAHIHSPVGGQGMNTGLQDAYNLAWKLAGVINNQLAEGILNSYAAERMPVAKKLLATTDRAFTLILSGNWPVMLFKKYLLPKLINWAWGNKRLRVEFFKVISQTGIAYRNSAINLHVSQATKIKAGDRLPYLEVYDEKKQRQTDLHEWCGKPGFTLMIFGNLKEQELFTLAKWLTQTYPATINFYYLPPSTRNQSVFDAFEIKAGQGKSIIIRPDMYIGFINDAIDINLMDNYLRNVVGMKAF